MTSPPRRRGGSLKRRRSLRPELRTIVVFCEGKRSEPDYVKGLRGLPEIANGTALRLEIAPTQGVPFTLVKDAAERKKDPEVDECWCLFDVEWPRQHPNLHAARELARAKGVQIAVSNPCFELWLVLHFKDANAFTDTESIERESRRLDGRKSKGIDASVYMPLFRIAAERAARLELRHVENGTMFPNDNPSSGMHHFLQAIGGAP